jgi:FKBP-type peptidyl-prolyl cis-trans isomerase (trigger factor)
MKTSIEKLPKAMIKLSVILESTKVKEAYEQILEEKIKTTKIEGFREGKAPKQMVEEKLGVSSLYGDAVNKLLQTYYPQALKENHIMPVSNPRVEIKEFDLEKDFEFTAEIATKPDVAIKDYKKALQKTFKDKAIKDKDAHLSANETISILLENSEVEIADILIDEEVNRMMARLVDQTQALGMSIEQYLRAQHKTVDELRKEYSEIAKRSIKTEFVLSHLVNEEKIEVTDKEITETFNAAGVSGVQERAEDPTERIYVKMILQKNKLINKLIEMGESKNETK